MAIWVVTQDDVEKHSKFEKLSLERILWSLGMDTRKFYEEDGRELLTGGVLSEANENIYGYTYRSILTGEVGVGKRYVGSAREDGEMGRVIDRFLDLPLDENRKNRPKFAVK